MRKFITATVLAVLLGVSGLGLTACDQDGGGGQSAPGAAPGQSAPGGGGGGMPGAAPSQNG